MIILEAPSSKSYSHRYLFATMLSKKERITLHNLLDCEDTQATKRSLALLGLTYEGDIFSSTHTIFTDAMKQKEYNIYVDRSATLSRMLSVILMQAPPPLTFTLNGEKQLQHRSHALLSYYASLLNAHLVYDADIGHLPYHITPQGLPPSTEVSIDNEHYSSQYISGLLFAMTHSFSIQKIHLYPAHIPSFPYIASTLFTLLQFGIDIQLDFAIDNVSPPAPSDLLSLLKIYKKHPLGRLSITLKPSSFIHLEHTVPSDFSAISYLLCFGILGKVPVQIHYHGKDAPQADIVFVEILKSMGAHIKDNGDSLIAYPSLDRLRAIDIDVFSCPDLFPTLAIVQAFAFGNSRIYNTQHIRKKECDRILAICSGLRTLGFDVKEEGDMIIIGEAQNELPHNITIPSYHDHRIVMAFSLFNIVQKNTCLFDDYDCVKKSFPKYWEYYHHIL